MSEEKRTILLVDDDEDFVYQQRLQLEVEGYEVVTASSLSEAMEAVGETRPDIALVDLMMEELDSGFTLCHRLKQLHPSVPVIMVTGVTGETGMRFDVMTERDRQWIKADALIAKPVRFEQLQREIERLMKG